MDDVDVVVVHWWVVPAPVDGYYVVVVVDGFPRHVYAAHFVAGAPFRRPHRISFAAGIACVAIVVVRVAPPLRPLHVRLVIVVMFLFHFSRISFATDTCCAIFARVVTIVFYHLLCSYFACSSMTPWIVREFVIGIFLVSPVVSSGISLAPV